MGGARDGGWASGSGYFLSSGGAGARRLPAASARSAPAGVVFAAVALVGVGYAGCQVFPLAMLPDAAAVDARRTGSSRVGVYTGVWTAAETFGLALGPGLFALVLALGGYESSTDGDVVQSSETTLDRDHLRLLGAARGARAGQPGLAGPATPSTRARWRRRRRRV